MSGLLAGRCALVTGAGSGIGRAAALAFAAEGARVAAADIAGAAETADMIARAGGTALALAADMADEAEVAAMVTAAVDRFGRLDCAFNNAGIAPGAAGATGLRLGELSRDSWERLLGVNLTGVFLCLKHELLHMDREGGGGAIVNTASIAGMVGLPRAAAYVASKHGVIGLTRAAAIDYADRGIRVNAVCPGFIETPMTADTMRRRGNEVLAMVPTRRLGQPEEIAQLVVWLCSDNASFVTGAAYAADGGYTAA